MPSTDANKEAKRIVNFAWLWAMDSVNARLVMKIDMVNPIPPRQPTPSNCNFETPSGIRVIPNALASRTDKNIPKGLPITRPARIPNEIGCRRERLSPPPINWTPAFAKAKIGRIIKLETSCSEIFQPL
jgi:hypothetical protein